MLTAKKAPTGIPAAPAKRQMYWLGATKISGYAAFENQPSALRRLLPQVRVRFSIQVMAASPYHQPSRKKSGSLASSRAVAMP